MSFLIWARESRRSAYLCENCSHLEAAKALFFTALLGWLSIPSWLFMGWRSTYINWRSAFSPPSSPLIWGALSVDEFVEMMTESDEAYEAALADEVIASSPLQFLTEAQQRTVLSASQLYELLDVPSSASVEEIRGAFRAQARADHPDLNEGSSTARMVRINEAWEVLGSETMRGAYDWLEAQRDDNPYTEPTPNRESSAPKSTSGERSEPNDRALDSLTDHDREIVINSENLYETLELHSTASLDQIGTARDRRMAQVHPDLGLTPDGVASSQISLATTILLDPDMRKAYDWLEFQRARGA
jgi:curved DNA-binding protein CbpA